MVTVARQAAITSTRVPPSGCDHRPSTRVSDQIRALQSCCRSGRWRDLGMDGDPCCSSGGCRLDVRLLVGVTWVLGCQSGGPGR